MTFSTTGKTRGVIVAGRGAAATAVIDALAMLPGVGNVRQVADVNPELAVRQFAGADVIVDMVGGIAPAFATAMAAMGNGLAFITANPLLVAAHGRVLHNAAIGQQTYFGFQAAGFGLPVAEVVGAVRPHKVTASFVSAASTALMRMAFRNETLGTVSAHMKMQNVDLSDWGGKVTQARAMALRGLWNTSELRGSQLRRIGVETVEIADIKRLRMFGLQPVFGAEITEDGIYTGPLAVAPDSPLIQSTTQDVVVMEARSGTMVMSQQADEIQRVVAGVVADMRQFIRSPRPALNAEVKPYGVMAPTEMVRAFVRIPYTAREQVLASKPEIFEERTDADGMWQAVIAVTSMADIQFSAFGGMAYPLAGEWEVPAAGGLRLVG